MTLEMPIQNWQPAPIFFPSFYDSTAEFNARENVGLLSRLNDNNNYFEVPNRFESPKSLNFNNEYSQSRDSKSFSIQSRDQKEGIFYWGTLDDADERSSIHAKNDDGVVLLVGLFNLFAVVAYAAQKILSGSSPHSDSRAIYWQVQKALDELVLRVHSSDAAANLISRALKSSVHEVSGRQLNENTLAKSLIQLISEKNHSTLKSTINTIISKLNEEIAIAPSKLLGPRIDPRIYEPIKQFYRKIMEPSTQGREFSSTLFQEINEVARILSNMTLNEIKKTLKTITQLGKLQHRYNIVEELRKMVPSKIVKNYGVETIYDLTPSSRASRNKRASPRYSNSYSFRNQGQRSRHPRFSKAGVLYKARRMKELSDRTDEELTSTENISPTTIQKRQGPVEQVYQGSTSNWADGWFTLLTQASPVGLDIITLYSRVKSRPQCLRVLMCKANGYWKKRGAFHAALSPFLSVLASWGMETQSPFSLGDSLIAIRAGWMGKHCSALYPECEMDNVPHPLAEHALNFFTSVKKNRNDLSNSVSSQFSSKSGEIYDNQVDETNELRNQITHFTTLSTSTTTTSTSTSTTTTTTVPTTQTSPPTTTSTTTTSTPLPDEGIQEEEYPYDRYDSPYFRSDFETLPSGSVTGMALQDRPLKRISVEFDQSNDEEEYQKHSQPVPAPIPAKITSNIRNITQTVLQAPMVSPQTSSRYPPYHDPKHLYIRNPVDNDIHAQRFGPDGGPTFLHQHDYSKYMASQRPTFIKQGHRSIPYKHLPAESQIKSSTTPKTPKPFKKRVKYKYGLRRGLPAHNVDGHSPLMETAAKIKASKEVDNLSHRNGPPARYPAIKEGPLDGKYVSHFGPKDAITDPFRNQMLYQFIRDRTIN